MEYNPFILKICRWFSKDDNEVYLLTSSSSYIFKNQKRVYQDTKFIYTILNKISNKLGIQRDLSYLGYVCRAVTDGKKFDPDIIFYIGYFGYFNPIVANFVSSIFNVPCVGDWIGSDLLQTNSVLDKLLKRYFLKLNDLNLVQSNDMKNKIRELVDSAKVAVSPDKGIDLELFRPDYTTNRFSDPKNNMKILYVGRLSEIKGLGYLIESFKNINHKFPSSRLEMIGDGPVKRNLKKKIDDLGMNDRVDIKGYVKYEELPEYYRSADIFVLPSLSEGLSNVLMEAMACGLPVVATDVGGNGELILDGKGGYLVPPKEPSKLYRSLKKLIENPQLRNEMGHFNERYVERYEQMKILNEKLELFKNIMINS